MSAYGGFTNLNIEQQYISYVDGLIKLLSTFAFKTLR